MNVTSIAGNAPATRGAMRQPLPGVAAPCDAVRRAVTPPAFAPPSPSGGIDARSLFQSVVNAFDRDGDWAISKAELDCVDQSGMLSSAFGKIDGDSDGQVTGAEVAAFALNGGSAIAGPTGGMPLPTAAPGMSGGDLAKIFDRRKSDLDTNSDGKVSVEEQAAADRAKQAAQNASSTKAGSMMQSVIQGLSFNEPAAPGRASTDAARLIYALLSGSDKTTIAASKSEGASSA